MAKRSDAFNLIIQCEVRTANWYDDGRCNKILLLSIISVFFRPSSMCVLTLNTSDRNDILSAAPSQHTQKIDWQMEQQHNSSHTHTYMYCICMSNAAYLCYMIVKIFKVKECHLSSSCSNKNRCSWLLLRCGVFVFCVILFCHRTKKNQTHKQTFVFPIVSCFFLSLGLFAVFTLLKGIKTNHLPVVI